MKLSELSSILTRILAEDGDVDVKVQGVESDYNYIVTCVNTRYILKKKHPYIILGVSE